MSLIGAVSIKAAVAGVGAAVSCGSEMIAGHLAFRTLVNIKEGCASQGAKLAGKVGYSVGSVLGRALAGNSINAVNDKKHELAGAIRTVGTAIATSVEAGATAVKNPPVDAAARSSSLANTALKVMETAAIIGSGVAAAAGLGPVAAVALAGAAVASVPRMISAATESVKPNDGDIVGNVVVPVAKKIVYQAISTGAGNVVRFDYIVNAHAQRIDLFKNFGEAVGRYMPSSLAEYCKKAGELVGRMDAGRYAMSDAVIAQAHQNGDLTQNVVQGGLEVADAVISNTMGQGAKNWKDTASNVAWMMAAGAGAAALVAFSPEFAAVTGGMALLGVMDRVVKYGKAKVMSPADEAADKKQSESEQSAEQTSTKIIELVKASPVLTLPAIHIVADEDALISAAPAA